MSSEPTTPGGRRGWIEDLGNHLDASKGFFEDYTGLKDEDLRRHLYSVREHAWQHGFYPCVGSWAFLKSAIKPNAAYANVIKRARKNDIVIDIGTGMGQELRWISYDAGFTANTRNFWATDLRSGLWNCGYELFRDSPEEDNRSPSGQNFNATMVDGDIFSSDLRAKLSAVEGEASVIVICWFFHLFNLEKQEELGRYLSKLAGPGCLIVGAQVGCKEPRTIGTEWGDMYQHNKASWEEMWERIGNATKTKWKPQTREREIEEYIDYEASNGLRQMFGPYTMVIEFALELV